MLPPLHLFLACWFPYTFHNSNYSPQRPSGNPELKVDLAEKMISYFYWKK